MPIKQELAENLLINHRYRDGDFTDKSLNNNDGTAVNSLGWVSTSKGYAIDNMKNVTGFVQIPDGAMLNPSQGTLVFYGDFPYSDSNNQVLFSKRFGANTYLQLSIDTTGFSIFDGVSTLTRAHGFNQNRFVGVTFEDGNIPTGYIDGQNIGAFSGAASITSAAVDIYISNFSGGGFPANYPINEWLFFDTILTGEQMAQLWEDLEDAAFILATTKREFQFPRPAAKDKTGLLTETSNGVVGGVILDLEGTSAGFTEQMGTSQGSYFFGNSINGGGSNYYLSSGAVEYTNAMFNGNGMTLEWFVKPMSLVQQVISTLQGRVDLKILGTGNRFSVEIFDGANKETTSDNATVAGQWYHIVSTSTTNGTMKLYINSVLQADTESISSGYIIEVGVPSGILADFNGTSPSSAEWGFSTIYNVEKTGSWVAERFAQLQAPIYVNDFTDYPVTIGSAWGTGSPFADGIIQTGTWKIGHDITGKHLLNVTNGRFKTPVKGASNLITKTFTVSGSPTLTKNANDLQIDAVAGEKIYNITLTI